jgi:hypothetical protein
MRLFHHAADDEDNLSADRYEALFLKPTAAFLTVMVTTTVDNTASAPFLAVVNFPTPLSWGITRERLWKGAKPATLLPSGL